MALLFIVAALPTIIKADGVVDRMRFALILLAALTIISQVISLVAARRGRAAPSPLPISSSDMEELERVRVLLDAEEKIRETIARLGDSLNTLAADMATQDSRLDGHRRGVIEATTLREIQAVEDKLLTELDRMRHANHELRGQVVAMGDKIQKQARELDDLSKQAIVDPLTTVANRGAFDKRLAEEVDRAKRYKTIFSVILIDIDHFKKVNDSFGHQTGDRVLRAFAKIVDAKTRLSDFVSRFGGEEFTVILPATELAMACAVAEKVRLYFSDSILRIDKERLKVTASFGVSQYHPGDTDRTLIDRADAALYLAKNCGRNRTRSENNLHVHREPENGDA